MRVFGRSVVLSIGQAGADGLALPGFRVGFEVKMSRASAPNTAAIKVWNVSALTTAVLEGPLPSCTLAVGYGFADDPAPAIPLPIFRGEVKKKRMTRAGVDRVLELECQDGGVAWQHGRVVFTTVAPTSLASLIPIAAGQVQLPTGYIAPGIDVPLPHGTHVDEPFRSLMDRIAKSTQSTWSVIDGLLTVQPIGAPAPWPSAPLFSATGANLIGQPIRREKGGIEVRALLDPAMRPGRQFVVESLTQSGTYIAQDVRFIGDSGYDQPFYVEVIGRLPGVA